MATMLELDEIEVAGRPRRMSARSTSGATGPIRSIFFPTDLGWIGVLAGDQGLLRLTFGHDSAADARAALGIDAPPLTDGSSHAELPAWISNLVARLQSFAAGHPDDFADVPVIIDGTPFTRRVIAACRRIGCGQTRSYADLAREAGSPKAARAVGHVMATNPVALVVPCHRVVGAAGRLGGYSARGGLATKRLLLKIERNF